MAIWRDGGAFRIHETETKHLIQLLFNNDYTVAMIVGLLSPYKAVVADSVADIICRGDVCRVVDNDDVLFRLLMSRCHVNQILDAPDQELFDVITMKYIVSMHLSYICYNHSRTWRHSRIHSSNIMSKKITRRRGIVSCIRLTTSSYHWYCVTYMSKLGI